MNKLINNYSRTTGILFGLLIFGLIFNLYAGQESERITPWEGKEVFDKKGCRNCHSVKGSGGEDAPDLGEEHYYGTYLELASLMWNHIPDMIERIEEKHMIFPSLSEEETIQLLRYISYIRYWGESGNERVGRKLLKEKNCTACHKFGGEGNDIGPDITKNNTYLSPLSLAVSMWNHLPEMTELAADKNIDLPLFRGDEMVDIASGIKSYMQATKVPANISNIGDPDQGEQLIRSSQCLHCHSLDGQGGDLGPAFSSINFNYSVTEIAGVMWNHGSVMYKTMQEEGLTFPKFTENQVADIIAYLYGLHMNDTPGDVAQGEVLINKRGCLTCHDLHGKGAGLSVDLGVIGEMNSPIAMISAMWNHAPAMNEELLKIDIDWPEFDKKDMANLYAYLKSSAEKQK